MHTKKTNNTNKLMQISYHSVLTKIQKLQNLKKKKKKKLFFYTSQYCPKLAGTASIFSGTKQEGYTYRFACRYGIFQPYWPVRYGIDSLGINILHFEVHLQMKFFRGSLVFPLKKISLFFLDFFSLK